MKNNNSQSHPLRFTACTLAAALVLSAALPAKAAVRTDAQLHAVGQPVCDLSEVPLRKSPDIVSKPGQKRIDVSKIELSLEDAVAIAQKEAARYYRGLRLTMVYSYDNDNVRQKSSGENGKREWWYVNFANEASNYVSVLIADGEIVNAVHFDNNFYNGLFDLSDVAFSAEEAVKKAKALGLRGGDPKNEDEWVSGYNFNLSYSSLATSPDDIRLFFEVIGISPNGNFAHVDFDAVTGELLLAEEKIESKNGDVRWQPFH